MRKREAMSIEASQTILQARALMARFVAECQDLGVHVVAAILDPETDDGLTGLSCAAMSVPRRATAVSLTDDVLAEFDRMVSEGAPN